MLGPLHLAGQLLLVLGSEKVYPADLSEVHPHRVIDALFQCRPYLNFVFGWGNLPGYWFFLGSDGYAGFGQGRVEVFQPFDGLFWPGNHLEDVVWGEMALTPSFVEERSHFFLSVCSVAHSFSLVGEKFSFNWLLIYNTLFSSSGERGP